MTAKRVEGVRIERAADEILALKPGSMEAHALNLSAAAVYDLCDGTSSKADMAAEIRRRTSLPADEEIVDLALAELEDAGLVELSAQQVAAGTTRRSLVRRLALSSMAALMLPVVDTVLVPSEAAAASGDPGPTPTPTPTPISV